MKTTRQNSCRVWALIIAIAGTASTSFAVGGAGENTPATALQVTPATFDVAPAVKRKVSPVYPYEMLLEGRTGWAEATFVIDYTGRALFANPKDASDPAFAKAVVAMVEASQYVPGKRDKVSVMSPSKEEVHFLGESSMDQGSRRVLAMLRNNGAGLVPMSSLDERPKALRQDSPSYPRALKDDGLTGHAEIEFVVDRDGRVLFPRILSASHEDFGWAAATAVAQWRYQPPQMNGQKVDARMRVPILFDDQKLASSD